MVVLYGGSGFLDVLDGGACVDGVSGDDGVGEEGEAFSLKSYLL